MLTLSYLPCEFFLVLLLPLQESSKDFFLITRSNDVFFYNLRYNSFVVLTLGPANLLSIFLFIYKLVCLEC